MKIPILGLCNNFVYIGNDLTVQFTHGGIEIYQLPTCPEDLDVKIDHTVEAHPGIAREAIRLYTSSEGH